MDATDQISKMLSHKLGMNRAEAYIQAAAYTRMMPDDAQLSQEELLIVEKQFKIMREE